MGEVLPLIILLFILVPLAELYLIVQVAQSLGVLETVLLLLAISIAGGWLIRREGLGVLARIQRRLAEAQMPTKELVDGALLLFAGALLLTPGFLTDGVGLLFLFPPTRAIVRTMLIARYRNRLAAGRVGHRTGFVWHHVVDVEEVDDRPPPPDDRPRGELDR